MIISASIQAADQLNILQSIQQHSSEFDQIHVDITDGHFTNNISMSFSHIKEVKSQSDYKVDVQLMVEDNVKLAPLAFAHGADLVSIHLESTPIKDFINLSNEFTNLGVATLPNTDNSKLDEYLEYCTENIYVLFPEEKDARVADAILEIFRKRESIDIFNKKAIYLYIRDMVDVKTPHITRVADQLGDIFKESFIFYKEHGYTNFS